MDQKDKLLPGDIVTWRGRGNYPEAGIVIGWSGEYIMVARYSDNPEAECDYHSDPQKECLPNVVWVRVSQAEKRDWIAD